MRPGSRFVELLLLAAGAYAAVPADGPACGAGSSACFAQYCKANKGLCTEARCFGVCLEHNRLVYAQSGEYNFGDACNSDPAEHACKKCPAGRFSPTRSVTAVTHGATECEACPAGRFQDAEGQAGCKACATQHAVGGITCPPTAAGDAATAAPAPNKPECVFSPWSGWSPCVMDCGADATSPSCTCSTFRSRAPIALDAKDPKCKTAMDKQRCNGDAHHGCYDAAHSAARARAHGDAAPANECPSPPTVHYATHVSTGYHDGAKVFYQCANGFHLSGRAEIDCACAAGAPCAWSAPPVCSMQVESPIGTPRYWVANADEIKKCHCDPAVHIATDVRCVLETHRCEAGSLDECLGNSRTHRTIRVKHIKGAKEHRHHKCAYDGASASCRCCDCTRVTRATNGCPCGAAEGFFSRAWQMGSTKYWWSFKPKSGTTTCEVRGELKRGGWVRGTVDGDVYADGTVAVRNGRLSFEGGWTQPSDVNCPDIGATVDPELAWASLHGWEERRTECGFMHFFITPSALDGAWRYKSWPKQESWDVNWRPPLKSVSCTTSADVVGVPSCSVLHESTLFPLSGGPACYARPMPASSAP